MVEFKIEGTILITLPKKGETAIYWDKEVLKEISLSITKNQLFTWDYFPWWKKFLLRKVFKFIEPTGRIEITKMSDDRQ